MDGGYVHGAEGVGSFYTKFMVLLDKQPKYFGAGLKTIYAPPAYKCRGSKRHMDAFKSAEKTPGREVCSKTYSVPRQLESAEANLMVCTGNQLLPRFFSQSLLYFRNTFFYLNNEGTGEYL